MQVRNLTMTTGAATLMVAALLLGLLLDAVSLTMLAAALMLLIWHYSNLYRVNRYLWHSRRFVPPEGRGNWGMVFDGIYKLHQRHLERRRELGELIRRFREGAEAMPDGVLVLGDHHSIIWCNGMAQRLLGLRWPDDRGQRLDNLIRGPEMKGYLQRRNGGEAMTLESPAMAGHILELRLMPYGEDQRLMVIGDITKLRKLERVREDFVANVSHELRTPLTVIKGYLEMMAPDDEDPLQRKALQMMTEQCARMDCLVAQLSELSSIEAHATVDFSRRIDVPALLQTIEQEMATLLHNRQLSLRFEVSAGLQMLGDQRQMRSAFSNLVVNAIKYTPDGGHIDVLWRRTSRGALFMVSDDGEGIAAEHLARLTERFYRVDSARTRKTGGSGLGLSIVKHALANHQSRIQIDSELTKGSRFSFVIPEVLLVEEKGADVTKVS